MRNVTKQGSFRFLVFYIKLVSFLKNSVHHPQHFSEIVNAYFKYILNLPMLWPQEHLEPINVKPWNLHVSTYKSISKALFGSREPLTSSYLWAVVPYILTRCLRARLWSDTLEFSEPTFTLNELTDPTLMWYPEFSKLDKVWTSAKVLWTYSYVISWSSLDLTRSEPRSSLNIPVLRPPRALLAKMKMHLNKLKPNESIKNHSNREQIFKHQIPTFASHQKI